MENSIESTGVENMLDGIENGTLGEVINNMEDMSIASFFNMLKEVSDVSSPAMGAEIGSLLLLGILPIILFFVLIIFVTLVLKAVALYEAIQGKQKWWFVALFIIQSFGILEIIYLLGFKKKASATVSKEAQSTTQTQA